MMQLSFKGLVAGAVLVAGATLATAEAQAMPVGPLAPAVAAQGHIDQVYYYGYRRPFVRRFVYRRPFVGYRRFGYRPYYGFRRPFYGYRRPLLGFGFRAF